MKNLYLALVIAFSFFANGVMAQNWITVSPAFADQLRYQLDPDAVTYDAFDASHVSAISLTTLYVDGDPLNRQMDIDGISALSGLRTLNIGGASNITELPYLPTSLTILNIRCSTLRHIRSFDMLSLEKLVIWNAELDSLPVLPNSLEEIEIQSSSLKSIPNMPTSLTKLYLTDCPDFFGLPPLNNSLQDLSAPGTKISTISAFPASLESIDLSGTSLNYLPILPQRLTYLNLSRTNVVYPYSNDIIVDEGGYVVLDSCPGINIYDFVSRLKWDSTQGSGGIFFSAANNGLNAFPQFRIFVKECDLSGNPISSQPGVANFRNCNLFPGACHPFSSLRTLYLYNCGLSALDLSGLQLPKLDRLSLSYNNFPSLRIDDYQGISRRLDLNSCNINTLISTGLYNKEIYLYDNNISCLPYIGDSVTTLNISSNPLLCISNTPKNVALNLPVCSIPCFSLPVISGIVFNDLNRDGVKDVGESGIPDILVKFNPEGRVAKTDSTGKYQFKCLPGGPYDLAIYPYSMYSYVTTSPAGLHISGVVGGTIDSTRHIGFYTDTVHDIQTKLTSQITPRPGFSLTYRITASNMGSTTQNGSATFKFDPSLMFQSTSGSGIQSGDSITWTFSNLLPGAALHYDAVFEVPATTPLGTSLCARSIANGNTPDTTIYNNRDSICQTVIGSYDPNDKTAYPGEVLTKEQMVSGEGIDYVVRFQNTGTASAINVRVEDTISSLMEAATIRMIASSHVNEWRIDSGNVLKVFFDNINLPDSGANELLSHGFFRYSIRPKAGTNIGDSIKNTALIYFDFNAPIVTNTVKTDVTTLFAIPIAPQTVCEGQPLNLNFTDNPAISKIEWLRNDTALGIYGASLNIPNATLAHNGQYSVKITLNNDAVFTSAKSTVTVNPSFIPSVSIAQTTQNICSGDLVSFTATPGNGGTLPVYQWFINGALNFSGGNVLSVILNGNDEVKAVMTSSLSCVTTPNDTSNLLLAAMDTLATTSVSIVAPTGICEGQSAAITTISNNAGNAAVYQWSINGQVVQNANTATLTTTLQNSDVVGVELISSLQCVTEDTVSASQNITTTAAVVPTIALSASADNNICNGSSQSFIVSTTNQGQTPVYTWYVNGTVVSALTSDSVQLSNLTDGDIVYAVLQSNATCATPAQVSSQTDTVKVIPAPDKPTISQSGSTLTSDAIDAVQWLLNGTPVQGANSASYTAEVNGVYSVLVTDNNGCTALSDTIGMRILSLGSINISQAISVYPNPFSSQVTLQLDADLSADSWSYKLLNVSGQTILQADISQNITTLNMEEFAPGIYMLHVQGSNGNKAFRLVKY